MRTIRLCVLVFIAFTPFRCIRRMLYRKLFGFSIASTASIDMFNILDIKKLTMESGSRIRGFGNIFLSVHNVEFAPYARIGGPRVGLNLFRGTSNKKTYPEATFRLGPCSIVELFHYFDLCANIEFGANVVVGGIRSAFFTHTLYKPAFQPITIMDNVYIGSNCLFQMNTSIPSQCVVGMGAVVVKEIDEENSLVGGSPAHVIRSSYGYSSKDAFRLRNLTYYDNGVFVFPKLRGNNK